MKEQQQQQNHGGDSSSDMGKGKVVGGFKSLKSLLKKPGQTKPKGQKNRVVINEKLNEFFAADYIILIKEECCADYEEECDCCCQEHEMIRLGNCKECRAELSLQFQQAGARIQNDSDPVGGREQVFNAVEGIPVQQGDSVEKVDGRGSIDGAATPPRANHHHQQKQQQHHHQQQETLSPPEGYKDVCEEGEPEEVDHRHPVCAECNYYHQQSTDPEEQPGPNGLDVDVKSLASDSADQLGDEDSLQDACSDQAQQTTPDLHQRFLVETITMTTVTERRIVRELQGTDDGNATDTNAVDEADSNGPSKRISPPGILKNNKLGPGLNESRDDGYVRFDDVLQQGKPDGEDSAKTSPGAAKSESVEACKESGDPSELSLTFKIGNVSLVTNSLKPNSAVRQLFPDPRFISPPPVGPSKTNLPEDNRENNEDDSTEGQKFLITTESLRLFDAVKRSKLHGGSTESEPEPTTIRKTIERNALRRSLISKYETPLMNAKKKNLRSKEFTLEERIRQLTCLDLDDNRDTESSASENTTTGDSSDYLDFPVRTSPSGEEAKTSTTSTVQTPSIDSAASANPSPQSSTYKKITDLFANNNNSQKKSEVTSGSVNDTIPRNLPDLGIGNKFQQHGTSTTLTSGSTKTPVSKMNSDARKQFLASLAPLSCVAGTGIENREDYYQLSSNKVNQGSTSSRDSVSCNSDSSYSLEDIESALRGEDQSQSRNFSIRNSGPPDVTRGTPTNAGDEDSATEELLAFVEQDKSRTERIRKRYNDQPEENQRERERDDEDDELNDYGFNRRPSVRGIKPKFGSTNEIMRQLQSRSSSVASDVTKQTPPPPSSMQQISWPSSYSLLYDNGSTLKDSLQDEDETYQTIAEGRESSTINRINTMQRQIDDIYQTIAETAASVQGSLSRGSYLESTLPRPSNNRQISLNGETPTIQRFSNPLEHKGSSARMLRIAGGGEPQVQQQQQQQQQQTTTLYGTLPAKHQPRRHPSYDIPPPGESKCYRTMYLVPYSGISDPTYQNIQRILPPLNNSTNYANHLERYPYPRNAPRVEEPRTYYTTRHAAQQSTATLYSQSALHLHLQDDLRVPNTLAIHHGVHGAHTIGGQTAYGVQTVAYPHGNTMRGSTYPYQLHLARGPPSDVQTQTANAPPGPPSGSISNSSSSASSSPLYVYNNANVMQQPQLPSAISTNILTSSPTKIHQQRALCTAAERGVPEGAASAPSHDFIQSNSNPLIAHPGNGPPPNTQNSVYYAMNV